MRKKDMYTMREEDFAYYLAGLFEGDGHISNPGKNALNYYYPRFNVTSSAKNIKLMEHLLEAIGHGFIRHKRVENAVVLTVGDRVGLLRIINLLNGRLYTPKITAFHEMIDIYNNRTGSKIEKLPLRDPTLNNH